MRARQALKVTEVSEMLSLPERYFPAGRGLYKKGERFAEKIALFTFNFPAVEVPRCADTLEAFAAETGWKVETNSQCNITALKPLLARLLQGEKTLSRRNVFQPRV